jgi:hypothetical protein
MGTIARVREANANAHFASNSACTDTPNGDG